MRYDWIEERAAELFREARNPDVGPQSWGELEEHQRIHWREVARYEAQESALAERWQPRFVKGLKDFFRTGK